MTSVPSLLSKYYLSEKITASLRISLIFSAHFNAVSANEKANTLIPSFLPRLRPHGIQFVTNTVYLTKLAPILPSKFYFRVEKQLFLFQYPIQPKFVTIISTV